MSQMRIGISGWRYGPWRGVFYPADLPQKRELEYASRRFNSIEINGTFYSLQRPSSFRVWKDSVPADFLFAVKCPRYITHIKRLLDFESPLANFFASGVLGLSEKLGPLLWQFPPNFKFDEALFERFFDALPRNLGDAAKAARRHDANVNGRTWIPRFTAALARRKLRHAIEFRHESFCTDAFIRLLRRQKIGLVIADTAGLHPYAEDITADFVYIRLHGDEEIYASGYTPAALDRWAERLRAWTRGSEPSDANKISQLPPAQRKSRDAFVYFDNDIKVHAPYDAESLMDRMKR